MGQHKRKPTYHDKIDVTEFRIVPRSKNLSEEDVNNLLVQYVTGSRACLKKFVDEGHFEELAWMYARDKKSVTERTEEVRKLYAERLDTSLLPDCYVRRQVDILKGRIQAVLSGAAQRLVIAEYITQHPEQSDKEVAQGLWHEIKEEKKYCVRVPNAQLVGNVRRQMQKSDDGRLALPKIEPDFGDRFSFAHGDNNMSRVRRQGDDIVFSSGYQGKRFDIIVHCPGKDRYRVGKVCKPDLMVYAGEDGELRPRLSFAVQHSSPASYEPVCSLGVDVGEVYPFVCAVVGHRWHSQGVYPDEAIMRLVDQMNDLSFQIACLSLKIKQDSAEGRKNTRGESLDGRVKVLEVERQRLADRLSRLKKEVAHQVAHRVCELALPVRAQVVLEKLNWSDPKHAFFHQLLHDAICNRCLSLGVPVVVVPARGSSAWSPENGSVLSQGVVNGSPVTRSPKDSLGRSSWRSVDCSSGLRDKALRGVVSRESGVSVEKVSFERVVEARLARKPSRGARDRVSGRVRDHDYVAPLNLGVRGEVARHGSCAFLSARLASSRFVQVKFVRGCGGLLPLAAPGSVVPSGVASGSFALFGTTQSSLDWLSRKGSPMPLADVAIKKSQKRQQKQAT